MSTTAPQYTNSSVYTLPTPQILGAYPDTPFSAETTGADTPKANYNQREGPLEAAGRNISQEDKGTMTSDLQPANDAKSGFPVHLMPDDLRHAAGTRASSVYSQPDDTTATHANGEVSQNNETTEHQPASRPDFPEVSQASHVAVKDAPINEHAENKETNFGEGTSASAMHTDSVPAVSGTENSSDDATGKLNSLNLNDESAGARDSGIEENRPLSAASEKTGMSDSNSFLSTGILPNATTDLPAVAPVNSTFPRASDERSLAESIPMPTQHLTSIRTPVPGGWNEHDNRSSMQSTAAPDYASREGTQRQASYVAPSAALLEATSAGPSGESYPARDTEPVAQSTGASIAPSSQTGLGSSEPTTQREMSPDEYYQHARLGLRNASFTSTQKHELDLVPQATNNDNVSVAAAQQDMSRSGSQQTQRTRFTDDKKDAYPEEKREEYPEEKREVYPEDRKSLGAGRSTKSSTSLREKEGHGKGALVGAGVAGAGAGYGASRLAGDDRGYAAARDYNSQPQQQYHSAPQNNFMSPQGQRQNSYRQDNAPFQNTQYQQNQPHLTNVTPLNVGLGAPTGTADIPATRDAPAPVAAYGTLPAAAHQPIYNDNEHRRSNIFDSMSGVPDPTVAYNQPQSRTASIRNAGNQSRAGSVRHSARNSVAVLPVEPAHQVQVVPPAQYVEEEEVVEEPIRPVTRSNTVRTTRSRRSTIPENPAWASHKETKSTKWMPANPLWQRTPPKPAKKNILPMSPWSPDPPGYRRRLQREKEEQTLHRRKSLPMHPFAKDQPKRRSTVSSRRSTDDNRPVSRGATIVRPVSRASTVRVAPSPVLVSGTQEHSPNKLQKAQSVRSNRTASRVFESTPSGHVGEVVPQGGLGDGFPTQPGRIIAQEKVGPDVMYEGAPGVNADNMTRNHSVSTAGVGEGSTGHGILRNSQSQENARHTVRPGNMQPTYSYSNAPSAPGVQRYPMQRGETGFDPAASAPQQEQQYNGEHPNHLMHQVSLGQQAHSQQYGGVQNAQQMTPQQQGQSLSSYPPQAARSE